MSHHLLDYYIRSYKCLLLLYIFYLHFINIKSLFGLAIMIGRFYDRVHFFIHVQIRSGMIFPNGLGINFFLNRQKSFLFIQDVCAGKHIAWSCLKNKLALSFSRHCGGNIRATELVSALKITFFHLITKADRCRDQPECGQVGARKGFSSSPTLQASGQCRSSWCL